MAALAAGPAVAVAQIVLPADTGVVWLISDRALDERRLDELTGAPRVRSLLLRSTSSLLNVTSVPGTAGGLLLPEFQMVANSALPFSVNDGALWAGKGANLRAAGGFWLVFGRRLAVVVAPELTMSQNDAFVLRQPGFFAPPLPPDRSEFSFPWYQGPYSIDMPLRFGEGRIARLHPGQSSLTVTAGPLAVGVASENHWWGPGLQNALILSNNAPGFPHAFLRSARPLQTRLGEFDFRWLVGGLGESDHFDTDPDNDMRSLNAAAVTFSPGAAPGVTVGVARSVWGTASGWGDVAADWYSILARTGRPNNRPLSDSTLSPGGRDQLYSIFARWVLSRAGLETYAEWGRSEFPSSIRDFLLAPNHTQAYTLGLQWTRPGWRENHAWRLQAENTSVEQSATFRDRPLGVWYTSRRVVQGYTNDGQPIGAAVGPGSSGQSLLVDYNMPRAWFGVRAGRMRFNEDVRSIYPFPEFQRWCNHDVSMYAGVRGGVYLPVGLVSADATFANRVQPWFQTLSGCPGGDAMIDVANHTLTLTVAPFARR